MMMCVGVCVCVMCVCVGVGWEGCVTHLLASRRARTDTRTSMYGVDVNHGEGGKRVCVGMVIVGRVPRHRGVWMGRSLSLKGKFSSGTEF